MPASAEAGRGFDSPRAQWHVNKTQHTSNDNHSDDEVAASEEGGKHHPNNDGAGNHACATQTNNNNDGTGNHACATNANNEANPSRRMATKDSNMNDDRERHERPHEPNDSECGHVSWCEDLDSMHESSRTHYPHTCRRRVRHAHGHTTVNVGTRTG